MDISLDEVDLAFAVNLAVLRDALTALNRAGRRWWVASDPADAITNHYLTIGYGDPGCVDRLNTLYYRVPVLNECTPRSGTARLVVLLDSSLVTPEQPGLYFEKGRVVQDEIADVEDFLFPILRALAARFEPR